MAGKKQPTNLDLSKQIADVRSMQSSQAHDITMLQGDVLSINKRHELIDTGKAAVDQYKKEEKAAAQDKESNSYQKLRDGETKARTELWVKLAALAALVTAGLYAYLALKGIKP